MSFLVMAHLVGNNGKEFLWRMFLDQCIEQDNPPRLSKAGKESVCLGRSFRSVHFKYALHFEMLCTRVGLNCRFKFSILEGRKLVEQGHYHVWRNENHQNLDNRNCQPSIY